jgi:hypothetical protein
VDERRKLPRKKANEHLSIVDTNTGKSLGQVVNITTEGFMLVSQAPIPVKAVFQLLMELENPVNGQNQVAFGAESLWASAEGNEGGYNWTGFHIIDISKEAYHCIDSLIEDW